MKFNEFKYERPNFEKTKEKLEKLVDVLNECKTKKEFLEAFNQINKIRSHVTTMATLSSIRNSIDTSDEFYDAENNYWDEISPMYEEINTNLYKKVIKHPLRDELKTDIPETFFKLAECAINSFDVKIIPYLQEENKLVSKQAKLYSSASIHFDDKIYNLSSIGAKMTDKDRDIRKRASKAKMDWFADHEEEIDDLFDQLVNIRTKIAKELGYDNFIELGYYRMNRLDYDAKMVETYRNQVLDCIVPFSMSLFEEQRKRMGLEKLQYYDLNNEFLTGNPTPKGSKEELVAAANKMYHEMSAETGDFFETMITHDLFDLESKPNKQGGGYCTDLLDFKVPFIFSNFNGTSGDVDVLTHEAGHALQSYLSMKTITIPECTFPTMESAEINSMSMEFFAHPWMDYFFKEDTQKYYYAHVVDAIKFVPYGVLVDHFQHEIYANPECSSNERKKMWRTLEKKYLPHKDYSECELLEKGCWWYQQGHIFQSPFYYIDYTLAQVCALQFWKRMEEKDVSAWSDYIKICKIGGTRSFLEIVKEAQLKSPFEEGTLKPVMEFVVKYIEQFDSSKF